MLQVTLHVGRATVKVILTACGLHEIQTQDVLALLETLVSMFSSNQYSKNQTALIQQQKYEKHWKLLEYLNSNHLYYIYSISMHLWVWAAAVLSAG